MDHLLSAWDSIARLLGRAKGILLLSDFDGTLTPIVDRPEQAILPPETRVRLRRLAAQPGFTLGVISGRALADLEERVGVSGIVYAGNHGLEIEGPELSFVNPLAEEIRPVLRVMHHVLSRSLETIKGVFVEDKGLTLSVHYRMAEARHTGDVEQIVRRVAGSASPGNQTVITHGKKVYEVRPAVTWDKGKAIKLLMKRTGRGGRHSGLVPIYLGDDVTDEDAFRVIEAYGRGITVHVGEADAGSCARYFLSSPAEVAAFLKILLAAATVDFEMPAAGIDFNNQYVKD